jgi:hypothetical protein
MLQRTETKASNVKCNGLATSQQTDSQEVIVQKVD